MSDYLLGTDVIAGPLATPARQPTQAEWDAAHPTTTTTEPTTTEPVPAYDEPMVIAASAAAAYADAAASAAAVADSLTAVYDAAIAAGQRANLSGQAAANAGHPLEGQAAVQAGAEATNLANGSTNTGANGTPLTVDNILHQLTYQQYGPEFQEGFAGAQANATAWKNSVAQATAAATAAADAADYALATPPQSLDPMADGGGGGGGSGGGGSSDAASEPAPADEPLDMPPDSAFDSAFDGDPFGPESESEPAFTPRRHAPSNEPSDIDFEFEDTSDTEASLDALESETEADLESAFTEAEGEAVVGAAAVTRTAGGAIRPKIAVATAAAAAQRAIAAGQKAIAAGQKTTGRHRKSRAVGAAVIAAGQKALDAGQKLAGKVKQTQQAQLKAAPPKKPTAPQIKAPPPATTSQVKAPEPVATSEVRARIPSVAAPTRTPVSRAPQSETAKVRAPAATTAAPTSETRKTTTATVRVRGFAEDEIEDESIVLPFVLPSALPNVSNEAWTRFALALRTAPPGDVSASNELGMFSLKPRRLADLGIVRNLTSTRGPSGRMVWVGEFVPPLTCKRFLTDPALQYRALAASMKLYVKSMREGTVPTPEGGRPKDMSLSGALAILHRCGPSGIKTWNNEERRFPDTVALFEKTNGIF